MLDDGALGEYKNGKIYYDHKPEDIDALPDDAPHRPIDLEIVKTVKELGDKAKIAIMIRELFFHMKKTITHALYYSTRDIWLQSQA